MSAQKPNPPPRCERQHDDARDDEITESQGPLLSLPHLGALILDAVTTAVPTQTQMCPCVFAGEGQQHLKTAATAKTGLR